MLSSPLVSIQTFIAVYLPVNPDGNAQDLYVPFILNFIDKGQLLDILFCVISGNF